MLYSLLFVSRLQDVRAHLFVFANFADYARVFLVASLQYDASALYLITKFVCFCCKNKKVEQIEFRQSPKSARCEL